MKTSHKSAGQPGARRCSGAQQVVEQSAFAGCTATPIDPALPYCTVYKTPRGRVVGSNFFDVPPMRFVEGYMLGIQIAADTLAWVRSMKDRASGCGGFQIMSMVRAAAAEPCVPAKQQQRDRRGAAAGFLSVIGAALTSAAGADWQGYAEAQRADIGFAIDFDQDRRSRAAQRGHETRAARRQLEGAA